MKIRKYYEKQFYFLLLCFTCAIALSIWYISNQEVARIKSYYSTNIAKLVLAYEASLEKYRFFSKHFVQDHISHPDILEAFYKATVTQDPLKERYYKNILFRKLYPQYLEIKKEGIRQLQFALSDDTSFLRFHQLDKFGDNLSKYRPSIVYSNTALKPVSGFETGRIVSGFRNVFPLFYKQQHLGSVGIGVSTKAIVDNIKKFLPNYEFAFLLNKNLLESKLFDSQKYLYSPSLINSDFLVEDSNGVLEDSPKALSSVAKELAKKLFLENKIKKVMSEKKAFAKLYKIDNVYYDVILLPMIGINQQLEGYLASFSKTKAIPLIISFLPLFIALIIFVYCIIVYLAFKIHRKSKKIYEQESWFLDVNNSLGEGMYVIDTKANIVYVNPATCKILGYAKEELLGKSAHYTFHLTKQGNACSLEECSIISAVKKDGYIQSVNEYFMTKDGKEIPIELNARALYKDNKLYQIVTIFKDISEKKESEQKMKLLTKALNSSASAIIITDIDANIEWANPAFEKLTGYAFDEIEGKKPREFVKSGRQNISFYKQMWDTILAKKPWKGEIINKRKDGIFYYEELNITPVLDKNDNISNFIAVKQDISGRKEKEKTIEHLAYYDHLTNLPNRRLFNEHLKHLFNSVQKKEKNAALLFLDLDNFKKLNDTFGHDIGDLLLREVAHRLEQNIRAKDIVSRLGGDEFVIILDNLDKQKSEAQALAQRVALKLLETIANPFSLKELEYTTTVSIGIHVFGKEEKSVDEILKKADIALYGAKAKGRNTYYLYQ
jgi:diguanylate cyclase (GGDEF)-like protein/PAS domain S-box-containing protein